MLEERKLCALAPSVLWQVDMTFAPAPAVHGRESTVEARAVRLFPDAGPDGDALWTAVGGREMSVADTVFVWVV